MCPDGLVTVHYGIQRVALKLYGRAGRLLCLRVILRKTPNNIIIVGTAATAIAVIVTCLSTLPKNRPLCLQMRQLFAGRNVSRCRF